VDRLLAAALRSHVVTVVAGEGSGKTRAVNSFLHQDPRRVIWVQLSDRDNLGWRLWENYTGKIAQVNPEAAKIFTDMGFPESGRQLDRYLGLLQDGIIAREPYVIVFDDFHLLANPAILRHLERVITAPVNNTIVLISRTEPAMNTVNFLAKGLLSQVTVEHLRFTREETDAYFRLHHVAIEEEELSRICRETEGWALALGLILQELMAGPAGARHWDQVMQPIRKMEEYIFSTMEPGLQRFLLKLSLVEHWPRDFLERLDPGGAYIAAMEQFSSVIRFDTYLHGFTIHHLFLDFLREKQTLLSREEIREAAGLGAQWCVENNLPTDAAVDYERARDYGGMVRLIESLPRTLPRTVASFFLDTTERLLALGSEEGDGENGDFLFLRYIIHSRLLALVGGRFDQAVEECRKAIDLFEARSAGPQRSRMLWAAYNNLGILGILSSRYTGDYSFARWFEQGYRHYLENPQPVQGEMSQCNIDSYMIHLGHPVEPGELDRFIEAYAAAVPFAAASLGGYRFGSDTLARAELAYYRGDLNLAEQFARRAVYQGREKRQYEVENQALVYLMRIGIHRGDTAGIRELQKQLDSQLAITEYLNRYTIHDIIMGRLYARLDLPEQIAPWLKAEPAQGDLNALSRSFDNLIKARCLLTGKDYAGVLRTLEEERAGGGLAEFLLGMLEITVLEAVACHLLGDQEGAAAALGRAYEAAHPHGLDMPFIELGEPMYSLANALLKAREQRKEKNAAPDRGAEIPLAWLRKIRNATSAYAKTRALVAAQLAGRDQELAPDFSQHERAVLVNLSQGGTVEAIAGDMNISVNMVKSVIRSLYTKLGASNRASAIRIATARGLIP
jgi:LuxR family maltose regulon positive regulatory protein